MLDGWVPLLFMCRTMLDSPFNNFKQAFHIPSSFFRKQTPEEPRLGGGHPRTKRPFPFSFIHLWSRSLRRLDLASFIHPQFLF